MVDISNLTYEELNELEKAIKNAKKNYGSKFKGSLGNEKFSKPIIDILNDHKPNDNLGPYYGYKVFHFIEDFVYGICDYSLGNYTVKETVPKGGGGRSITSKDGKKNYRLVRNTAAILVNHDLYKQMYTDIFKVCAEYIKKS